MTAVTTTHPFPRAKGAVEEHRRLRRVASTLMEHLIRRAAETGRRRVLLHSSEVAFSMYLRMGFTARCSLPAYATTALHSLQPA